MGTNEYSQPASKSIWYSQDFGDVKMVLKWPVFTSPPGHNELIYNGLNNIHSFNHISFIPMLASPNSIILRLELTYQLSKFSFSIVIFHFSLSWFFVLLVFLVIVQSSELFSVWFCEKMTFFPNFFSYNIFAIYVGGASLELPTACRIIAVSGARLPSVDGLVVRRIKMNHHVNSAITICLQFI